MPNKLSKKEQQQGSSRDRTAPATMQVHMPDPAAAEISTMQMEEILSRARQTVKPIINREAANEVVSEEILNFKMV